MSVLSDQVRLRQKAKQLKGALGTGLEPKIRLQDGIILSPTEVAVKGQRYPLDSSGTGLQPGQAVKVKPATDSRLSCAKYTLADVTGAGGGGGGLSTHDIIGPWHWVKGNEGLFVGISPADTLALLDPNAWIRLWIGREEGPRFGLRKIVATGGVQTLALEGVDTANHPFFDVNGKNAPDVSTVTNTSRLRIGYQGQPGIYLEEPTSAPGEPEQPRRIVVDLGTLAELITANYIDLADLAEHYYPLLVHTGDPIPDALAYAPGVQMLQQDADDPNQWVRWVRDPLDNWQLEGGAGHAPPHSHTSDDTGGIIAAAGGSPNLDGGHADENYGGITALDAGGA